VFVQKYVAVGTASQVRSAIRPSGVKWDQPEFLYCPLRSNWSVTTKYSAPIAKTAMRIIGTIGTIKQAKKYFIFTTITSTTVFVSKSMQILRHGLPCFLLFTMCLFMKAKTAHVRIDSSWIFLDKGKGKNKEKGFPRY
jgi:hypothetical protein